MKSPPALPCLFLTAWCNAHLDDDLRVTWSDGEQTARLPLLDALARLKGRAIALIVPVEHVASCAVNLPAGNAHWQRKALPYAVEPLLAEDVEDLHLALGETLSDGRQRVVAINRSLLEGWLQYLRGKGAQVSAIHVDADLLPNEVTTLCWGNNRCLLAGTDELRLALAPAQLPALLQRLPGPCRVLHASDVTPQLAPAADVSLQALDVALPAWMVARTAHALDLAQGSFAPASRLQLRNWKPVAWALAAVLVAQLAFDGLHIWLLQQQTAGYRQVNESIYKGLFPQERRIVNLKAQFDQHLQQGASTTRLDALLASVAEAMPAESGLQVQQLRFDAGSGELTLQLQGGDAAAFESLQQRLRAKPIALKASLLDDGGMQLNLGQAQ
ncbi:type II secretion system protein GspL [Stenotrophomonas terrae]|uniref:type II secretion system protein GspL n=1 Tax=Stenotrophomonas terrae TaxID=405446 RepID=UPI0007101DBE|nr:type II secretion system protein GspL [Stenotrophomonas terrae]